MKEIDLTKTSERLSKVVRVFYVILGHAICMLHDPTITNSSRIPFLLFLWKTIIIFSN
jgi:hypothetical protein